MKTYRWFNQNRFTSIVRVATAGALVTTAAALAFVATTNNVLTSRNDSPGTAFRHRFMKHEAQYGLASRGEASEKENLEDPTAAATEDYEHRAFPAAYVPFQLTVNAQKTWAKIKSQKGKNTAGNWTLAGPSIANFPAVLTFSGLPIRPQAVLPRWPLILRATAKNVPFG